METKDFLKPAEKNASNTENKVGTLKVSKQVLVSPTFAKAPPTFAQAPPTFAQAPPTFAQAPSSGGLKEVLGFPRGFLSLLKPELVWKP